METSTNDECAPQAEAIRLFLGIDLPPSVRAGTADALDRLQKGCRFVNAHPAWVRAESIHVTLVFLGWQNPSRRVPAERALAAGVAGHPSFDISLSGLALFPTPRNPKVVSLGIQGKVQSLVDLQVRLAAECAAEGFELEDRPYRPHITLARIKALKGLSGLKSVVDAHRNISAGRFTVSRVTLFQSFLEPGGARYVNLAEAPLAPGI